MNHRRVARLEAHYRPPPVPVATARYGDPTKLSDGELRATLLQCMRDTLADPHATPEQHRHAAVWLSLPWDLPTRQWTLPQLRTFRREAMGDRQWRRAVPG